MLGRPLHTSRTTSGNKTWREDGHVFEAVQGSRSVSTVDGTRLEAAKKTLKGLKTRYLEKKSVTIRVDAHRAASLPWNAVMH